jgi:hypothetical protein
VGYQRPSQQRRADVDAILTRIASDPAYRRQIQSDPSRVHDATSALLEPADVVGFSVCRCSGKTCKVSFITR